jgi:hypothetical protein
VRASDFHNFDGTFCQCANKDMLEYHLYRVDQACPSAMPDIDSGDSMMDAPEPVVDPNPSNASIPDIPEPGQCGSECQLAFGDFLKEYVKCFGILAELYSSDSELVRFAIEEVGRSGVYVCVCVCV